MIIEHLACQIEMGCIQGVDASNRVPHVTIERPASFLDMLGSTCENVDKRAFDGWFKGISSIHGHACNQG